MKLILKCARCGADAQTGPEFDDGIGCPACEPVYRWHVSMGAHRFTIPAVSLTAAAVELGRRAEAMGIELGDAVFDRLAPGPAA